MKFELQLEVEPGKVAFKMRRPGKFRVSGMSFAGSGCTDPLHHVLLSVYQQIKTATEEEQKHEVGLGVSSAGVGTTLPWY